MRYPRLHRYEPELDAPPTFRMSEFARTEEPRGSRRPHEAELAVERVQRCLDRLDELLDPLPFQPADEDEGPWAA